jgi:hypothetical protein
MTTDRITTVETKLELVEELLVATARHAERAHDDNDALRVEMRRSSERMDASIAALVSAVSETNTQVGQLAQTVTLTNRRVDSFTDGVQRLITRQQDSVSQHTARLERLEDIAQSVLNVQVQTARRIELLEQQIELQRQSLDLQRRVNDEHRRTTDAALERIDRVLDYLVRRDGE